jgi:hypothetical protein
LSREARRTRTVFVAFAATPVLTALATVLPGPLTMRVTSVTAPDVGSGSVRVTGTATTEPRRTALRVTFTVAGAEAGAARSRLTWPVFGLLVLPTLSTAQYFTVWLPAPETVNAPE